MASRSFPDVHIKERRIERKKNRAENRLLKHKKRVRRDFSHIVKDFYFLIQIKDIIIRLKCLDKQDPCIYKSTIPKLREIADEMMWDIPVCDMDEGTIQYLYNSLFKFTEKYNWITLNSIDVERRFIISSS